MCDLDQEFHYAEKTIEGEENKLYLFSNENLKGVASAMDYFSENVLLVAGSGDGYFASIYHGADIVDIFDIHPLTKPLTYLKIAALKVFDYETFFIFFSPFIKGRKNAHFLSVQILSKLEGYLDEATYRFWIECIKKYDKQIRDLFAYMDNPDKLERSEVTKYQGYYQSKDAYMRLQRILRKRDLPEFYWKDYRDIASIPKTYSRIYLSNILEIEFMITERMGFFSEIELKEMKRDAIAAAYDGISPILDRDGIAGMNYMRFAKELEIPTKNPFNVVNYGVLLQSETAFPAWGREGKDAVLTFKKY